MSTDAEYLCNLLHLPYKYKESFALSSKYMDADGPEGMQIKFYIDNKQNLTKIYVYYVRP